jgi:hypothetical protein
MILRIDKEGHGEIEERAMGCLSYEKWCIEHHPTCSCRSKITACFRAERRLALEWAAEIARDRQAWTTCAAILAEIDQTGE